MSALVLRWLNEELQLHHKVEVLERDASNGYIIAEVLHLQGLEPQFETYQNSSTTAAKIHNMELLGEKLETLGVPFPVNTRRAIMMEERSAVLQFLLQLKDFLRRRPKTKSESPKAVQIQPPVKAATVKSNFPPRDVEERFIAETIKKFHPKDVDFHKGIDMAVHLRKFEMKQWEIENQLDELQQKAKADKNSTSTAGYSAARAHLQEKAEFMRDWDQERKKKWKQTQRRYLATEHDDLRLELALEARRQLAIEEKLAESQHGAVDGVTEFEKNMNRLGLAGGGVTHSLRAIPATDNGALTHLRNLEKRVEDLDFRPSNNVKMMKELRKRRKAQLAAEKDRRMRRQKALADQKKVTAEMQESIRSISDQNKDGDNQRTSLPAPVEEVLVNPREKYLEEKKQELQEHYARLRETGSVKREESMKTLEEFRIEKWKKQRAKAQSECSEVVDGLISLAVAIVTSSDSTLDIEPLTKELFRSVASPQSLLSDQGGQELRYELDTFIHNFLSCSEVWATLPLQSKISTYDVKSDIQALAESWKNPTAALDTSWTRPSSFVLVSVFTEDESGVELARRVSKEHQLAFLQLEALVDECVRMSYDPQKIGDQLASLSDRERELGAFGPKISSLRVKNTPLPDSITVEIVAKAVSLCRREASATPNEPNGCILHNFPRSLDEAKLFEKIVLSELPVEESDQDAPEGITALPEEAVVSSLASAWDCVMSIASDQSPRTEEGAVQGPELPSKMLPAESQRKLALDEEQRAQTEEKRANLAASWGQTTRHIQIKPLGLHRDVLAEIFHLCVDVYSQTLFKTIPAVIECTVDNLPEGVKEERDKRRQTMSLVDRILWMKAANEMKLEDDAFANLLERLQKVEAHLCQKIREPMATIRSVIQAISALGVSAQQELESELFSDSAPFQALLDQTATKLKALKSSNQAVRERILTELEVSLGDLADSNRVAGNEFVNAFALDPFPTVMSAVDIVYQCLPSICLYLKDYTSRKLELLGSQVYDRVPFLREELQNSGRQVVLSKLVTQEAMTAATELGEDKPGEEVLYLLGQVAAEFSFHVAEDPPVQQYALSQTNVTTEEVSKLLQRVTLLGRFAGRLKQSVGQLYADDLQTMQQTVQQEIHTKDQAIAQVMADFSAQGRSTWPIRDLNLTSMSVASRRPRRQKENFLTLQQFGDLIHAFEHFEPAEGSTPGAFGASEVASDVFVASVLEVAEKAEFPSRWRDASAVAALTLQQCTTQATVSWRKFVWSLLCIQFLGFPALEDLLTYEQRAIALPVNKRQQEEHKSFFLSHGEFLQLPLWSKHNRHDTEKLKELIFRLFANQKTAQISLLPMLLHWCVHPSCFTVRHELEEFTPRYPRGLFRAFHVLKQHSASCTSALSALNLDAPPSLTSFLSFQHDCSNDLLRFFLVHDPLEALVQP